MIKFMFEEAKSDVLSKIELDEIELACYEHIKQFYRFEVLCAEKEKQYPKAKKQPNQDAFKIHYFLQSVRRDSIDEQKLSVRMLSENGLEGTCISTLLDMLHSCEVDVANYKKALNVLGYRI